MRVTAVIPALNEERRLGETIAALRQSPEVAEILVIDGGSQDATAARAKEAGARVISSRRGRAAQMNIGAAEATGDVLLFVHADVQVPTDAGGRVLAALADPSVVGGAFKTWTVNDPSHRSLGALIHLADMRSRYSRVPYGDQCLFVRRDVFRRMGGFPEIELMEDIAFSRELRRQGRVVRLDARVRVSGRRFQHAPVLMTVMVNVYPLLYAVGVTPRALARFYAHVR
jgi:rSAM/selenodomain-associated transferase 2